MAHRFRKIRTRIQTHNIFFYENFAGNPKTEDRLTLSGHSNPPFPNASRHILLGRRCKFAGLLSVALGPDYRLTTNRVVFVLPIRGIARNSYTVIVVQHRWRCDRSRTNVSAPPKTRFSVGRYPVFGTLIVLYPRRRRRIRSEIIIIITVAAVYEPSRAGSAGFDVIIVTLASELRPRSHCFSARTTSQHRNEALLGAVIVI